MAQGSNGNSSKASSIIKWAGGKQALASNLVGLFPPKIKRYYEPFIGGASVFLELRPQHATIGDHNSCLIDTYEAIHRDWQHVYSVLSELPNTKEDYLRIRSVVPHSVDLFTRAAHFIYLNKTCFRGLFRVNRKGQFNVPYGQYDRRYADPHNLAAFAHRLRNVEIKCGDFEKTIDGIASGDFAYFDPPYYKLGGYSDFNRYTADKFSEADHSRLASVCRELDRRSVLWAVSNSDTELVRNLFSGFSIRSITNRREINLSSSDRSIEELIIANFDFPIEDERSDAPQREDPQIVLSGLL